VALVAVALVDAVSPAVQRDGGSVINEVLAALTLLAVGGPLWWVFWRRIRRARRDDPQLAVASVSRRV
jgi:hypothetical protein